MFWPEGTVIKIGSKVIGLSEFDPWPPPEQTALFETEPEKKKTEKNYG